MRITLLLSVTITAYATWTNKKFGKHDFPAVDRDGKHIVNEFQLIKPDNIRIAKYAGTSKYELTSISPKVINSGDIVTVAFQTTEKPTSSDWIGAYSPANVNISETTPVKFGYCDDDDSYLTRGSGALTFNLTNLRADVAFYYFTGGTGHPVLQADSKTTVSFENNNQQLRPRVVATGDYDVFNLLWSSATNTQPILKWGLKSGDYTTEVSAETSRIDQSEVCGAPASTYGWRDLGLIHTAPFEGMKQLAGKKLYYIFGDDKSNDFSKEYIFNVPPLPGQQPADRPTTVILYDDFGRGTNDMSYTWDEYGKPALYTAMAIGPMIANGEIDAIYHGGDISYATGYIAVWDFFLDMLSPLASGVLYLTTVGNHETDWYDSASSFSNADSGGECGVLTTRLLPMPAPATTNEPWWSYDVGLIHFVGISTEHDFLIGSKQYKWLENDLKTVDRTVTPWIIFGGHRAMYLNSNYGGSASSDLVVMDSMIENLEPLLFKYKVNLGFYGHNHVVQRQSAVYNKEVVQAATTIKDADGNTVHFHDDPQATIHMVVGTGGARFTKTAVTPGPEWNELVFYEYGYAVVQAVNATYLDWKWFSNYNDTALDRMVITQKDPTQAFQLPK